jgi:hypothetical protein
VDERRLLGENATTRMTDITDGLSNTIMMAETTLEVYNGARKPGVTAAGRKSASTRVMVHNVDRQPNERLASIRALFIQVHPDASRCIGGSFCHFAHPHPVAPYY